MTNDQAETAAGLHALVTFDNIVGSYWYSLLQTLTPVKIGWGIYGFILYHKANRCDGGSYLNDLLVIYVFYFVFTLMFTLVQLVVWIVGFFLRLKVVSEAVRNQCEKFDAQSGFSIAIATLFFDKVVMRSRQDTQHQARVKECIRLKRERKIVEAKLAGIDAQLAQFEDVDEVSVYAKELAARVNEILREAETSHPDDIDKVLSQPSEASEEAMGDGSNDANQSSASASSSAPSRALAPKRAGDGAASALANDREGEGGATRGVAGEVSSSGPMNPMHIP